LGEGGTEYKIGTLVSKILQVASPSDIIVLTGGEPCLQPIGSLISHIPHLHVETNGTLPVHIGFEWVTISPKYMPVHADAIDKANEVKWLVSKNDDIIYLIEFLKHWNFEGVVSVQPVSRDPEATRIAMEACQAYGWRLSVQVHKFIEVR
jgi:7-carboxy-7-deazaguanine synthase